MPREYLNNNDRIEKFARDLEGGREVTSRDVVVALGNRSVTTRTVGQIFSSIPEILEMVHITNHRAVWRRK